MSSPLNMANINLTDESLNEEINKKAFEEISNIFDRYLFTEKLKKELQNNGGKTIIQRSKEYGQFYLTIKLENDNFTYDVTFSNGSVVPLYAISNSKRSSCFSDLRNDLLLFANKIKLSTHES